MGLWHLLCHQQQGHLAHRIIEEGYIVLSFLERLEGRVDDLKPTHFEQWRSTVAPFVQALNDSHRVLMAGKCDARVLNRVLRLAVTLNNLGYKIKDLGNEVRIPPVPPPIPPEPKGDSPCEGAPSTAAGGPSPPPCSPVAPTGSASTPVSVPVCGPLTKPGEMDVSEAKNCEQFKPKSSRKRGRGGKRKPRPSPVERKERGKGR